MKEEDLRQGGKDKDEYTILGRNQDRDTISVCVIKVGIVL